MSSNANIPKLSDYFKTIYGWLSVVRHAAYLNKAQQHGLRHAFTLISQFLHNLSKQNPVPESYTTFVDGLLDHLNSPTNQIQRDAWRAERWRGERGDEVTNVMKEIERWIMGCGTPVSALNEIFSAKFKAMYPSSFGKPPERSAEAEFIMSTIHKIGVSCVFGESSREIDVSEYDVEAVRDALGPEICSKYKINGCEGKPFLKPL